MLPCPAHAQVERIPEPLLAGITARILPALTYMHSHRMVHRDIKVRVGDARVPLSSAAACVESPLWQRSCAPAGADSDPATTTAAPANPAPCRRRSPPTS